MSSIILVHGGAGIYATIEHDKISRTTIEEGVCAAAEAGYKILKSNGSAVDAVQAAVMEMENNPIFNAGRGSCLTIDGLIEMDASIMDGSTLAAGGVACIRNVANPIQVSRLVMDKSDHALFTSDGALTFAKSHGIEEVSQEYLVTEKAKNRLKNFSKFPAATKIEFYDKDDKNQSNNTVTHSSVPPGFHPDGEDHDTVGAVALDAEGNVAYATSTGGITAKQRGRVGDSPIVGSGGYADNSSGAVSTTGHGEAIMRVCLAKDIVMRIENGTSVQQAVEQGLDKMLLRVGGDGGCIAIDRQGNPGVWFTTQGMAWAYSKPSEQQIHYGIFKGEDLVKKI